MYFGEDFVDPDQSDIGRHGVAYSLNSWDIRAWGLQISPLPDVFQCISSLPVRLEWWIDNEVLLWEVAGQLQLAAREIP